MISLSTPGAPPQGPTEPTGKKEATVPDQKGSSIDHSDTATSSSENADTLPTKSKSTTTPPRVVLEPFTLRQLHASWPAVFPQSKLSRHALAANETFAIERWLSEDGYDHSGRRQTVRSGNSSEQSRCLPKQNTEGTILEREQREERQQGAATEDATAPLEEDQEALDMCAIGSWSEEEEREEPHVPESPDPRPRRAWRRLLRLDKHAAKIRRRLARAATRKWTRVRRGWK